MHYPLKIGKPCSTWAENVVRREALVRDSNRLDPSTKLKRRTPLCRLGAERLYVLASRNLTKGAEQGEFPRPWQGWKLADRSAKHSPVLWRWTSDPTEPCPVLVKIEDEQPGQSLE